MPNAAPPSTRAPRIDTGSSHGSAARILAFAARALFDDVDHRQVAPSKSFHRARA
jgi:hypothetical protein